MSARRPTGIAVACVVGGLQVLLSVLVSMLALAVGGAAALAGVIGLALTAVQAAGLVGLWTMQSWGWWVTVGVYTLTTLGALLQFLGGSPLAVVGLAINATILVYVAGKKPLYGRQSTGARPRSAV